MSEQQLPRALGKAMLTGTLVGSVPVITLLALVLPFTDVSWLGVTLLVTFPLIVTAAFVTLLAVAFGLPVHFAFRRLDIFYLPALVLAAAVTGFMAPWVVAWLAGGSISIGLCLWGSMVGAVTAYQFARSLDRVY